MKKCPKCKKGYDNTWEVCFHCRCKLVEAPEVLDDNIKVRNEEIKVKVNNGDTLSEMKKDRNIEELIREPARLVLIAVPREHVLSKSFEMVIWFIETQSLPQLSIGNKDYPKMSLSIDGYNDDPRELKDIPEVIQWFKALNEAHAYIVYFMTPSTVQEFYTMLLPVSKEILGRDLSPGLAIPLLMVHSFGFGSAYFKDKLGDSYESMKPLLREVDKVIGDAVIKLGQGIELEI